MLDALPLDFRDMNKGRFGQLVLIEAAFCVTKDC
jgi:hypothetical protein